MRVTVSLALMVGLVMSGWPVAAHAHARIGGAGVVVEGGRSEFPTRSDVSADDSTVALLNLDAVAATGVHRKALLDLVSRHPEAFNKTDAGIETLSRHEFEQSRSFPGAGRHRVSNATKIAVAVAAVVGVSVVVWWLHELGRA